MINEYLISLTSAISGRLESFGSTHLLAMRNSSTKASEGQFPACGSTLVHRMFFLSCSMSASINVICSTHRILLLNRRDGWLILATQTRFPVYHHRQLVACKGATIDFTVFRPGYKRKLGHCMAIKLANFKSRTIAVNFDALDYFQGLKIQGIVVLRLH